MKRIVLIFGLLSGVISSVMMLLTMPLVLKGTINNHNGEVIGYTAIVLSFVLVFFGIRSYRENKGGGTITFGRAFSVGILITIISCVFYVATWEVVSSMFMPDWQDKYAAQMIAAKRQEGASPAAIAETEKQMVQMKAMLANPVMNVAMTFLEPFPVGLVVTLVSAAVLRRRTAVPPVAATAVA
jgi:hypothetical protein